MLAQLDPLPALRWDQEREPARSAKRVSLGSDERDVLVLRRGLDHAPSEQIDRLTFGDAQRTQVTLTDDRAIRTTEVLTCSSGSAAEPLPEIVPIARLIDAAQLACRLVSVGHD